MERRSCTAFEGVRRIASGELGPVALAAKEVLDRGEAGPVLIFDDETSRIVELDFRGTAEDVLARLDTAAPASSAPVEDDAPAGSSPVEAGQPVEGEPPSGSTSVEGEPSSGSSPIEAAQPVEGEPAASPENAGAERAGPPAGQPRGRGRPRLGVVAREVTLLPRHWEWLSGQPGGASVTLRKLVEEARRSGGERDRVRVARESAFRFMNAMAGNERGFEEAVRALYAGDSARFAQVVAGWPEDVRAHTEMLARRAFA